MAPLIHRSDPSAALEAAFRRIERERMAGMPLLNPALQVQAVDLDRWRGQWLGALITPWFVNLVLAPGDAASWNSVPEGQRRFVHFAAGDFAFLGSDEPELGEFQSCSLVSPPSAFGDQDSAVAMARAALRLLHVAPVADDRQGCAARSAADPAPPPPEARPARRVFLFGRAT